MGLEFQVEQHFDLPRERVFRALTDLDAAGEWMPGFIRIERVGGPEFGVGTEWRETRKLFGKEATEQFEVTSCEPPERMELRVDGTKGSSRRGEYVFQYHLEPSGAGTRVALQGEIRGLGRIAGLFGRLMIGPFKKACAKDLEALSHHLSAGA